MNYPIQAVATNGMACVLLVSLYLNYRRKYQDKNIYFTLMLISNFLQCVVETVTILTDGHLFPGAVPLSLCANSFLYANNIIFALLWSLYADARVHFVSTFRFWHKIRLIPALIMILGAIVNLFTPVYFRISSDNIYGRTGLFLVAYVITYFYLLSGTVTIYVHRRRTEQITFLPVFTFLFPVCFASIVQFFVQGVSLMWAGAAIGLASAYMSLLDESASTDRLSGLFSRHYFNQMLHAIATEKPHGDRKVFGMMLDVDDFKSINDTHGHLIGDDAITAAAQILRDAVVEERLLFRYAGDEFVLLMRLPSEEAAQAVRDAVERESALFNQHTDKPYRITFSYGDTFFHHGEDVKDFVQRMDAAMYAHKKAKKSTEDTEA